MPSLVGRHSRTSGNPEPAELSWSPWTPASVGTTVLSAPAYDMSGEGDFAFACAGSVDEYEWVSGDGAGGASGSNGLGNSGGFKLSARLPVGSIVWRNSLSRSISVAFFNS